MNSILKNFFLLCVAFVTTTAFAACGDDDDDQGGEATVSELKLTQASLTFTSTGGEQTFSVQAPDQVQVSADQPWCTATAGTMSANLKVTPVTVSVQPNTTTADRTATIGVAPLPIYIAKQNHIPAVSFLFFFVLNIFFLNFALILRAVKKKKEIIKSIILNHGKKKVFYYS